MLGTRHPFTRAVKRDKTILRMEKPRLSMAKIFVQGHTASKP